MLLMKKRFIPSHTHRKQAAKFAVWEDGLALESSRFNKTGTTVPGFNGFSFKLLSFQPARNPRMQTMSLTSTEKMGWIPDIPDHRDLHMTFSTTKEASKEIKKSLDFK